MIPIRNQEEIKIMAEGGKILAEIMRQIKSAVRPGITTNELNKLAQELVFKFKVKSAFLGYEDFPATLCTSVNEVIVHGIPSDYILKQGDIISLDLGIIHNCYYADMAITVPVGETSIEAGQLIRAVKKCLSIAIKKARPGNTLGDVGNTIERYLEKRGLFVVKELCGHGIGKNLHEPPEILNYGKRKKGEELKPGMTLCLEPMAGIGTGKIKRALDNYGFRTADNSLSAHFEHTIVITETGSQILTDWLWGIDSDVET